MPPSAERSPFQFSTNELKILAVFAGIALILCTIAIVRPLLTPQVAVSPIPAVGVELDEVTEVISSLTGSEATSAWDGEKLNRPVAAFVIDPNTAPADSLELLPGVGRVLADRIIEHRTKYPFNSPLDLLAVRGIGTSTYENLRHFIRIDPNRIPGKDQHKKDMK